MIRIPVKIFFLLLWTLLWFFPVWAAKACKKFELRDRFINLSSRGLLRIIGLRLKVNGQVSATRPLLLVTNHLSYLDVLIIGSQVAARFTPKVEIGKWPGVAGICRLTNCIFVDRRPGKINEMKKTLHEALAQGDVISLFPESTTGDGLHVLPFKSSFFSLAEDGIEGRELAIQPAAISYTHIHRLPIDSTQWPIVAWYGDMSLVPHLLTLLKIGRIDAELTFLPPVTITEHTDRKSLAAHCQRVISQTIETIKHQPAPPQTLQIMDWMRDKIKIK